MYHPSDGKQNQQSCILTLPTFLHSSSNQLILSCLRTLGWAGRKHFNIEGITLITFKEQQYFMVSDEFFLRAAQMENKKTISTSKINLQNVNINVIANFSANMKKYQQKHIFRIKAGNLRRFYYGVYLAF